MKVRAKPVKTVRIHLGVRSYSVQVGSQAVQGVDRSLKAITQKLLGAEGKKRAFVLADERLGEARGELLGALTGTGWEAHEIPVRGGESLKDIQTIYPIYGELLKLKANRDSFLFALGGGSVGDAAGFVAATYLRGIRWVGLPTTLLAQVDSAIGGKTAINHENGKNMIGAFHQPSLVVCDTDFLKTLSQREIISGLGETLKYGLIYDGRLFSYLDSHLERLIAREERALAFSIERSAALKARAVERDEFDRKGVREVLNFGHTLAHALEAATGYARYQHGEAVLWGMRFALALSEVRGFLDPAVRSQAENVLKRLPIPALPDAFGAERFYEHMLHDKKVRNGKIHFVLLRRIGKTISDPGVALKDVQRAYALLREGKR